MNAEPYDPQHACVVVHTGGTTGSPKGVMLTDNNFNGIAIDVYKRQGDDGCRKSIQHDAQAGQAVEDDEQLHQQRRAPGFIKNG